MLGERKDPAIKLFGKTIPLTEIQQKGHSSSPRQCMNMDFDKGEQREKRQGTEEEGRDDDEQYEKVLTFSYLCSRWCVGYIGDCD